MTPRELQVLIYTAMMTAHNEYIIYLGDMEMTHIQHLSYDFARITLPYTVCEEAEQYMPVITDALCVFMEMFCAYYGIIEEQFIEEFNIGYKLGEAYLNSLLPEGAELYESSIYIATFEEMGEELVQGEPEEAIDSIKAYENLAPVDKLYAQNLMAMVNKRMLEQVKKQGSDTSDIRTAFRLITEVCCTFLLGNLTQKKSAQGAVDFVYEWFFEYETQLKPEEYKAYKKEFKAALKQAVIDYKKSA